MKVNLLDQFSSQFEVELPFRDSLDDYLDEALPLVAQWGEDLQEQEYYIDRPWMEVRDQDNFHQAVLYYFKEGGELIVSVDGNISKGGWRILDEGHNKMMIDHKGAELYELAFLSDTFFILRKHGNQQRYGKRKYFVLGYEPAVGGLEWRDYVEYLFNTYRANNNSYLLIALFIIIVAAIIVIFSVF